MFIIISKGALISLDSSEVNQTKQGLLLNYLFAFNVIKQNVYIDEHHKNQKIVEKGSNGAHRKICLLFASDDVC